MKDIKRNLKGEKEEGYYEIKSRRKTKPKTLGAEFMEIDFVGMMEEM